MNGTLIEVSEIKNGMTVFYKGNLCMIKKFETTKPGKGISLYKITMRNIKTGTTTVETVHSDDKLEKAHIEKKKMFYSYDMGDTYVFMEENGNTIEIPADTIEEEKKFLVYNLEVSISIYQGEIIGITLPEKIEYEIVDTTDAVKGNTTNNAQKDAYMENGLMVRVPLFLKIGDRIIVSTEDGKYSSRA